MFLLSDDDKTYYLVKDGKYTVGRHVGEIIIKKPTVSRKHAEITIVNNEVFIRDCKSRYFTTYNGKVLLENEEIKLEGQGEIIFGDAKMKFLAGEKFITCCTGIKDNEEELRTLLKDIGGEYLKDWNDTCTHLTTPEIMVTLKVLYAIMDNKKIVTPNFWKSVRKNMEENKLLPDPSKFFPPLGESMIHLKYLEYNPNRLSIFANKTFVFWKKKRQSSMQTIIAKAGGKSILIPSIKHKSNNEILDQIHNCIVMDPEDSNIESTYSGVLEKYKGKGKRIIPIQEIVLAILQCSCEENCNPSFDRAKTVFARDSQKPGPSRVVIAETEPTQFESQIEQKPSIIQSSIGMESYVNTQNENIKTDLSSHREVSVSKEVKIISQVRGSLSQKKSTSVFKRPAAEPLGPEPKKSKDNQGNYKLNPFSVMKSKISARESTSVDNIDLDLSNNPFGQIQSTKEIKREKISDDVIMISDIPSDSKNNSSNKRKSEDIIDSKISKKRQKTFSKKNRKFVEVATIDFSELTYSISNGTWFDRTIKDEVKPTLPNLDEEEKKWCERFNNSVVIVSKNLLRKDEENVTNLGTVSSQSGGKNFKKFRKVAFPKSGQIIKCSKVVFGNSNLGIDYQYSDDEGNRSM